MSMKKLPGIGDLLKQSKEVIMKRKDFFLMIAVVPAAIQLVGDILLSVSLAFAPLAILFMIAAGIAGFLAAIALILGMDDANMKDWKGAYQKSKQHFWALLWVAILVAIVTIIGFFLLILPGIYLTVALGFYSFTVVLEKKKGWSAAERSKELVKGYWWAVFGRWFGFAILIAIAVGILGGVLAMASSPLVNALFSFAISLFLTPFAIAYSYLVYKALKKMKGAGKAQA